MCVISLRDFIANMGGGARQEEAMQLHQRGVDLLVNVLDAADHVETLSPEEIRRLLKDVADVMGQILERDAALALKKPR